MRWNGRGELVCPLCGQCLESRLAAQRSVVRAFVGSTMTSPLETFADATERFCAWAEGPAGDEATEAATARLHLARLYVAALGLREATPDWDVEGPTESEWKLMCKRFGALPFNYYSCVDPHVVPVKEPFVGDLADDLADIWRDLKKGLTAYRTGDLTAAEGIWLFNFNVHWGRHATDALLALHSWESRVA